MEFHDGLRQLLAEDRKLVTFRPSLLGIGKTIQGTILLSQVIYWDDRMMGKFYKFSSPCAHPLYKEGDSWEEELGMSAKEQRTALAHIAFKCGKKNKELLGDGYEDARNNAIITYYTDTNRLTWYTLNGKLLSKLLYGIYKESSPRALTETETTPEITPENKNIYKGESENPTLPTNCNKPTVNSIKASLDEEFEVAWKLYAGYAGASGSKQVALNAYRKWRQAGDSQDEILSGIEAYHKHVLLQRKKDFPTLKYKHGQTFFNQRCWTTEYEAVKKEIKAPVDFGEVSPF